MKFAETIEAQIEDEYRSVRRAYGPRTYYLTTTGKLVHGQPADRYRDSVEVGTYTSSIELGQFREDVFHVFATMKG